MSADAKVGERERWSTCDHEGAEASLDGPWVMVQRDDTVLAGPYPDTSEIEAYREHGLQTTSEEHHDAQPSQLPSSIVPPHPPVSTEDEKHHQQAQRNGRAAESEDIEERLATLSTAYVKPIPLYALNGDGENDDAVSVDSAATAEHPVEEEYFVAARDLHVKRERRDEMRADILDSAVGASQNHERTPASLSSIAPVDQAQLLALQKLLHEVADAEQELFLRQLACIKEGVDPERHRYRRISHNDWNSTTRPGPEMVGILAHKECYDIERSQDLVPDTRLAQWLESDDC